jgi:hypothetical protein
VGLHRIHALRIARIAELLLFDEPDSPIGDADIFDRIGREQAGLFLRYGRHNCAEKNGAVHPNNERMPS